MIDLSRSLVTAIFAGCASAVVAAPHEPADYPAEVSPAAQDTAAMRVSLKDVDVVARVNHLSEVSRVDLAANPVKSSQEILRSVPGLFIAQHAGGGKAEQMFLRGFDLDHGTDINVSVDGMPVNMVSHAHGQGYADLHFLQPEV
ncbi:MAG: Plug domain-containing protein, partial [Duncaniella sp.]|nr:Plug domain-containing protein [Duncaniella sp.]